MIISLRLKRHIDRAVHRAVRKALRDYGVAGMKKGQHVKARDPEYVESLKGGSGQGTQKKQGIPTWRKVVGGGLMAGGAALMAHGALRGLKGARAARKAAGNVTPFGVRAKNAASNAADRVKGFFKNRGKKKDPFTKPRKPSSMSGVTIDI